MNASIELHDSELTAIVRTGASIVLSFAPAYVHRSTGRAGFDAGSGWTQAATLTFSDATISSTFELPCEISSGSLCIDGVLHANIIPADGVFDVVCELQLVLWKSGAFTIRGTRLVIALHGGPSCVEEFTP